MDDERLRQHSRGIYIVRAGSLAPALEDHIYISPLGEGDVGHYMDLVICLLLVDMTGVCVTVRWCPQDCSMDTKT